MPLVPTPSAEKSQSLQGPPHEPFDADQSKCQLMVPIKMGLANCGVAPRPGDSLLLADMFGDRQLPGDPQRTVIDGMRRTAVAGSPSAAAMSASPGSVALSTARGSSVFLGRPSRASAGI